MKNTQRTLIIGFVWGLFFFLWWMKGFLYENWKFDLLSADSWSYLGREFSDGWVISSTSDWIFIFTLLISVPVFLYVWHLLLKVQWKKTVTDLFGRLVVTWRKKNAPKKVVKIAAQKSHKKVRPRPLNRIAKAEDVSVKPVQEKVKPVVEADIKVPALTTPPTFSNAAEKAGGRDFAAANKVPAFMQDDFAAQTKMPYTSVEAEEDDALDVTDASDDIQPLNEDVQAILIKNGYKVLKDVVLGTLPVNYIGVGSDYIVICLTDVQKGDWLADEERFNGEDPLWFSESSHRVSPVFQLTNAVSVLSQKLMRKGFKQMIVPVLIESAGMIINADDMTDVWNAANIKVCRTAVGGPETLPPVTETVPVSAGELDLADFNIVQTLL